MEEDLDSENDDLSEREASRIQPAPSTPRSAWLWFSPDALGEPVLVPGFAKVGCFVFTICCLHIFES